MKFNVRFVIALLILLTGTVVGLGQSSIVDPTFAPVPSVAFTSSDDALGKGILVQPDGKIVIWGGNFVVDGKARARIARFNPNGTLDETFTYCRCGLDEISNVGVQPDGKLLVGGVYVGQAKMIRLNPDGSLDGSFGSVFNGLQALA